MSRGISASKEEQKEKRNKREIEMPSKPHDSWPCRSMTSSFV
jgi:hypothetical protein